GRLSVVAAGTDEDKLMALALDAGADDMSRDGGSFEIICDPAAFNKVQEALKANRIEIASSEITQLAKTYVDTDTETARRVIRLVEAIDDHDDVQMVYSNLRMTEALVAALEKE